MQGHRHGSRFYTYPEWTDKEEIRYESYRMMNRPGCRKGSSAESSISPPPELPVRNSGSLQALSLGQDNHRESPADPDMTRECAEQYIGPCYQRRRFPNVSFHQLGFMFLLAFAEPCRAAFIGFQNCLSPNIVNSDLLQFTPLFVWASFNSSSSHNLNLTVYGNVSGQATQGKLPPSDDPLWGNPNFTLGKIEDVSKDTNLATTLSGAFDVLDYTPYEIPDQRFCNTTVKVPCPIGPIFNQSL